MVVLVSGRDLGEEEDLARVNAECSFGGFFLCVANECVSAGEFDRDVFAWIGLFELVFVTPFVNLTAEFAELLRHGQ